MTLQSHKSKSKPKPKPKAKSGKRPPAAAPKSGGRAKGGHGAKDDKAPDTRPHPHGWRRPFPSSDSEGPPGTRSLRVRALGSDLYPRYRDWVDGNRARVHGATAGRVGYVHVPDMERLGFSEFHRHFLTESQLPGLILDVRANPGGSVSELLLQKITQRRQGMQRGGRQKVCARRGGRSSPLKEGGWGIGKGALVTGQCKEAGPKPPMTTHHLRRKAAQKNCFSKPIPP